MCRFLVAIARTMSVEPEAGAALDEEAGTMLDEEAESAAAARPAANFRNLFITRTRAPLAELPRPLAESDPRRPKRTPCLEPKWLRVGFGGFRQVSAGFGGFR